MATWRVFTLDVWGNEEDGFEVNDRREAGQIETSDEPTDNEVWSALLLADIAKGPFRQASFDGDAETTIFIEDRETGRPVFQLERQ